MEPRNQWDDPELREIRAELTERLLWWRIRITDVLPEGRYETRRASRNWYAAHARHPG